MHQLGGWDQVSLIISDCSPSSSLVTNKIGLDMSPALLALIVVYGLLVSEVVEARATIYIRIGLILSIYTYGSNEQISHCCYMNDKYSS